MIVLGLTGSIGMGKSTAARMLRMMGVPVHESDKAAHAALMPGGAAFEEVAVTFPEAWDKKRHVIRRDILGQVVFADEEKRHALETIVHPAVWASQKQFTLKHTKLGRRIVVLDIPLLYETNAQTRVDKVICVTAPYDMQRRRVLSRPGMDEEKFLNILATQMSDGEKRRRADYVVETGQGLGHTWRALRQVIKEVKEKR
jgi:dephospho-CoA kinase